MAGTLGPEDVAPALYRRRPVDRRHARGFGRALAGCDAERDDQRLVGDELVARDLRRCSGRGTPPARGATSRRSRGGRCRSRSNCPTGARRSSRLPLAMGGYVLVPVVHIYGAKEVRFILEQCQARAYISPDRYGHVDYIEIVDGADATGLPNLEVHMVVGDADEGRARPSHHLGRRRRGGIGRRGRDRSSRRRMRPRVHVGHDE